GYATASASPSAPTTRSTFSSATCGTSSRAERAPRRSLRLVLVGLGLGLAAGGGRRRRRLFRSHEIPLLLVETRVHVVADLERRGPALAHAVVLAVVLGEQDCPERLALAVAQRHAEVRRVEPEALQVLRRLRRDAGAAQIAEVVDEALDGAGLRRLF